MMAQRPSSFINITILSQFALNHAVVNFLLVASPILASIFIKLIIENENFDGGNSEDEKRLLVEGSRKNV